MQSKLDLLKSYIDSFEQLPLSAMQQGISQYEFKSAIGLIYEILLDKQAECLTDEVNKDNSVK